MVSRAGVTVSAAANLKVEGTVDFVLLGPVNFSKSFCH